MSVQEFPQHINLKILISFNTSYVSVQESSTEIIFLAVMGFNTSYVSVQVWQEYDHALTIECFNTSYVSVQVKCAKNIRPIGRVSIHPMCRFKSSAFSCLSCTVIVSIHPMCRFKLRI